MEVELGQDQRQGVIIRIEGEAKSLDGNTGLLRVALRNALTNALKANNGKGEVIISHQATDGFVGICIADQGTGMPPEAQAKLMGTVPVQAELTRNGLGLFLIRDFMRLMNRYIEVEANQTGTRVTLWLPAMST